MGCPTIRSARLPQIRSSIPQEGNPTDSIRLLISFKDFSELFFHSAFLQIHYQLRRMFKVSWLAYASLAASTCHNFNNLVNRWNVITEGDMTLVKSDFEGRSWIGGTSHLQHFALGEKLYLQCSTENVLITGSMNAEHGNLCGGAYASNNVQKAIHMGSDVNCGKNGGRNCGYIRRNVHSSVSHSLIIYGHL